MIAAKKIKYTRNNKVMAFLSVEDEYGSVETVVFPNVYAQCQNKMLKDMPVLIYGRVDMLSADFK